MRLTSAVAVPVEETPPARMVVPLCKVTEHAPVLCKLDEMSMFAGAEPRPSSAAKVVSDAASELPSSTANATFPSCGIAGALTNEGTLFSFTKSHSEPPLLEVHTSSYQLVAVRPPRTVKERPDAANERPRRAGHSAWLVSSVQVRPPSALVHTSLPLLYEDLPVASVEPPATATTPLARTAQPANERGAHGLVRTVDSHD
mmetsp:Transcript_19851/g.63069  ORF Transcript_19851/g.63069 Transcript_19851/m.63069 type:complete len:201 (-) Transcript_19851:651-1253(-)